MKYPDARWLGGVATALIAVSSLAACASADQHPASAPAPVVHAAGAAVAQPAKIVKNQPGGDRGLSLPIESYSMKASQLNELNRAGSLLVSRCMASFGFSYQLSPSPAPVAPGQMTRRYGIMDAAAASEYGYHPAPGDGIRAKQLTRQLASADGTALPASEVLALTGRSASRTSDTAALAAPKVNGRAIATGGCEGQSQRAVNGGDTTLASVQGLVDHINNAGFVASEKDSRVRAAITEWASCMRARGYSFTDPLAAIGSADLSQAQPSKQEILTAVADISCKQQSNLISTWHSVEASYETAQIAKNAATLNGFRARFTGRLQWAKTVTTDAR